MVRITTSQAERLRQIRERALATYNKTVQNRKRTDRIDELGEIAALVESFVHGYTSIDDPEVDADDEIINWVFGDASGDLGAAIWCLSCGFYKNGAAILRSALDLAFTTLYFQIRQNTTTVDEGYTRFFAEWEAGERRTPNWGESKSLVARHPSVETFNEAHGCDVVEELHGHFKYLSAYTHGSAVTSKGGQVRSIMFGDAHTPSFAPDQFNYLSELVRETMSWIATIWQVSYPQIIETEPLGPLHEPAPYKLLFGAHDRGIQALAFRG